MTERQREILSVHNRHRDEAELLLADAEGWDYDEQYAAGAQHGRGGQPYTIWNGPNGFELHLVGLGKFELRRGGIQHDGARIGNLPRLIAKAI